MHKNLIGVCGLYCGACDNYLAFQEKGSHLLKTEKYMEKDLEPLKCSGCNSKSLSEHCSKCQIMKCAKSKGYLHCGQCHDFPCNLIKEFRSFGEKWEGARHRLDIMKNIDEINKLGEEKWLSEYSTRWTCECGQSYSYYEKLCSKCGEKLSSYEE